MSYDIEILVKIEGIDEYATYGTPEYDSPTYNLRDMFVACMEWDYSQGEIYNCNDVIEHVERGIRNLRLNREKFERYNPPNGWGDLDCAIEALESLRTCIYECAESIPIEHLWMRW